MGLSCLCGCAGGGPEQTAAGLQSDNPSVRMDACVQAARSRDSSAVPLLVDRLNDPSSDVRFCAIRTLKSITGQTFDYPFYQDDRQRAASVARWREWLRSQAATRPSSRPGEPGG